MKRLLTLIAASSGLALTSPTLAQDHSMHNMAGMSAPAPAPPSPTAKAKPKPKPKAAAQKPARGSSPAKPPSSSGPSSPVPEGQPQQSEMPAMDHSTMQGTTAAHDEASMPATQATGTALPAGNAAAPKPPTDHYADRKFSTADMARARMEMMHESGGQAFGHVLLNIFEYQLHSGRDGYRWDGEAWYGGDINRLWLKSEGEGEARGRLDSAEVQALYGRAIGPYFNLQIGIRQDIRPTPARTYATVGFEGLAPGFFEVEGAVFLSNKGDLIGRIEGYHDQRITQRLILQPRLELNLSAQDIPENDIGSGVVDVELGARLRYEITRQFAPYAGVSYLRKTGDTARYARLKGEGVHSTSVVLGIRFWF